VEDPDHQGKFPVELTLIRFKCCLDNSRFGGRLGRIHDGSHRK
jgi:hypothetical protein